MCNRWHQKNIYKPQSIKESGEGWKIIYNRDGEYTPMCSSGNFSYRRSDRGYIKWQNCYPSEEEEGFCFFLTEEEAIDILINTIMRWEGWKSKDKVNFRIVKIEYKEGIGSCLTDDNSYPSDTRFAFCKQFKFVEENNEKKNN